MPLPDTLAVPTVIPPLVHDDGGEDCGPNTTNVTVPVGAEPPASDAEIDAGEIALPAVPDSGTDKDKAGLATVLNNSPWVLPELSL